MTKKSHHSSSREKGRTEETLQQGCTTFHLSRKWGFLSFIGFAETIKHFTTLINFNGENCTHRQPPFLHLPFSGMLYTGQGPHFLNMATQWTTFFLADIKTTCKQPPDTVMYVQMIGVHTKCHHRPHVVQGNRLCTPALQG